MKQERWSLDRYRAPYLEVRGIQRVDDALALDSRQGLIRLSCDDAKATGDILLPMLTGLRTPSHELWRALRERSSEESEQLRPLLRELDHLGLIRDSISADPRQNHVEIEQAVRKWSAEVGRDMAQAGDEAFRLFARIKHGLTSPSENLLDLLLAESNFAVLTLLLQARYLREYAPAVLALLITALQNAERQAKAQVEGEPAWSGGIGSMPSWAEEDWSCALVDPAVLRRYLVVMRHLLRDGRSPDAIRFIRAPKHERSEPMSGINFIIDLEGEVASLLAELGTSPVVAAMENPVLAQRVVKASFLQEYLVTCRFVDCLSPLLARQFPTPLRQAVHGYFAEEMGHEKLERDNCLRLGISAEQIDAAEALPLHVAFVDVLTQAARQSPIAFFCSSMFTEGLIGSQQSLVSLAAQAMPNDPALIAALGEHVAVNEEADHRGVGRDWMSHIPVVGPGTQQEVREWTAYLAELNWRMWDQLVRSCH